MDAETVQTRINNGKTIQEFIDSPVVQAVFDEIERAHVKEFANADNDDKRRDLWAKSRALVELKAVLQLKADAGKNAKIVQERQEALAERNKRVNRAR